jgi:hypothetical protein
MQLAQQLLLPLGSGSGGWLLLHVVSRRSHGSNGDGFPRQALACEEGAATVTVHTRATLGATTFAAIVVVARGGASG